MIVHTTKYEETEKDIQVTNLKPYFTKEIKMKEIVIDAWIITEGEEKELVVKFNEMISRVERTIYLMLIGEKLINMAENESDKSTFGSFIDGIKIREWKREDEQIITSGISHEIIKEEK